MKTARHSGKAGDIIFSLPVVKKLGIEVLMIPERTGEVEHLFSNVRTLLLQQPYVKEVVEYPSDLPYTRLHPDWPVDVDLDNHRMHRMRGVTNMVTRYAEVFGTRVFTSPWLQVHGQPLIRGAYSVINVTQRHRGNVQWKDVIKDVRRPAYFIGTAEEHACFAAEVGDPFLPWLRTDDLLSFALAIKYADVLFCNQSCALAIAQGIGKDYFLEVKPDKTNCLFYTPNEHIL